LIEKNPTPSSPRTLRKLFSACSVISALMVVGGCGKKGPPLPPLVKLPTPPANFTAERRGAVVDLRFDVPAANTDNTRPANIARVDVYAMTSQKALTEEQIIKQGTRVASVDVKAPKDPDQTIEEEESTADMEAPEGKGLDQGAVGHASETLNAVALVPVQPKVEKAAGLQPVVDTVEGPLLPPRQAPLARAYVAVGVSTRDRKGPPSKRLLIPLVPPPAAPHAPVVTYDEKAIAVKWDAVAASASVQQPAAKGELASRPLGAPAAPIAYNVYDGKTSAKLTPEPLAETTFSDQRLAWGEERCYVVRSLQTLGDLKIESDAPPPACQTLTDTFAPKAPANLQSSPAAGAISLIWDANSEPDLAGYIVLRGTSPQRLEPMFEEPIKETIFRDDVQPGIRFIYVVLAVDRAGNRSAPSKPVEDAARE
jgi:predicted small lipoprotein YifL